MRDLLEAATRELADAGVADAAWNAERLLLHVMGWDRARLLSDPGALVPPSRSKDLRQLVTRRRERHPLQHLLGVQAFWHSVFRVTPDVFIPRPETELLVETALPVLRGLTRPLLADVGTGSGCLALSLAREVPAAQVHAVDISPAALDVARENARALGVAETVHFHEGSWLAPLESLSLSLAGRLDVIVSNPPYIDRARAAELQPEVRNFEPALALYPPGGPYAAYEILVPQAARMLRRGGLLLLEVGQGMAERVASLCRAQGLLVEQIVPDLQGIPRVVSARSLASRDFG